MLQDIQRWNDFNEAIGQQQEEHIQCPGSSTAADISPLSLKKRRVFLDDSSQSAGEISSLTAPAADEEEVITVNSPEVVVVVAEERSNVETAKQNGEKLGNLEIENDDMIQQKTQVVAADRNEHKHASSRSTLGGLLTRGDVAHFIQSIL